MHWKTGLEQNSHCRGCCGSGGSIWELPLGWDQGSHRFLMDLAESENGSNPRDWFGTALSCFSGTQHGLGLAIVQPALPCAATKTWLNTHPSLLIQWEVIIFQGMSHRDCCPPLGCCVQEFNAAAAGIETFGIKWVFSKALETNCQTNGLTMLMLCGVSLAFSKCLYGFYS